MGGRPPPTRNVATGPLTTNNVDEQLKAATDGVDWYATMCEGWNFAQIANEDRVVSFRKKLQETYPKNHPASAWEKERKEHTKLEKDKFDTLLPMFVMKAKQLENAGEIEDRDCLLHALSIMSGEMSFAGERIQLLFATGHIYEAVVISQLLAAQMWTPFYPLASDYTPAILLKRKGFFVEGGSVSNIWQNIRTNMMSFHNVITTSALQKPELANAFVKELARHCELPEDWAGHPSKVDMNALPLRVTAAWFNVCLQKQLPELLALSNEKGMDTKGPTGQSFLHDYSLMGTGLPITNAKSSEPTKSVMTQLLERGADPRISDSQGFNALHLAVLWANQGGIRDLNEFKAGRWWRDLTNSQDNFGRTPHKVVCNAGYLVAALGAEIMDLLGGPCPSSSSLSSSSAIICMGLESTGDGKTKCPEPAAPDGKENTEDPCDIDVVDLAKETNFDAERFVKDYVSVQRPVVIRNAFAARETLAAKKGFAYDPLVSNIVFDQGIFPSPTLYGLQGRGKVKLSDFAQRCLSKNRNDADCTVDGNGSIPESVYEVPRPAVPWIGLREMYKQSLPEFARFSFDTSPPANAAYVACPHFNLGPEKAGTNMLSSIMDHSMLYTGKKQWWFLTPMLAFNSKTSPMTWQSEGAPKQEGLLTCIQQPGDLVFVPNYWARGSYNLEESLSMGCNFEWLEWHTSALLPVIKGEVEHFPTFTQPPPNGPDGTVPPTSMPPQRGQYDARGPAGGAPNGNSPRGPPPPRRSKSGRIPKKN
eukprot:gb/GEZN01002349.1/.p1 GENE.gb/GEZN01002349.1/~~gb/GEZN01002349.1/.p1  ORF type:complete len:780 (-),score=91.60 gb/GEZN01002349.1/:181-2463(-)